ncbi:MAG: M56 family metallopeptidase, partial [Pseudomonadota bacterium]
MIDWLIGTFVATSGLMVLVMSIREPVRRHCGAAIAYSLWLLPAARMAMPSLIRTVERAIPATSATTMSLSAGSTGAPITAGEPGLVELFGGWPAILVSLWLAGAAVFLVRGLAIYREQRRLILCDGVQLARIGRIRLVRSERVRGPMAFGIFDPIIVVPFDFDQRFSECQRRLALDHELAHHRAGDLVANHIAFVLLCLQWFNPLAWAAHAAFRFDQEAACDARVLDKSDGLDRASYGEAIAKAASGRTLLFSGALDRPSTLSKRLTLMTYHIDPRRRTLGFAAVVAGVLVALPLTATSAINYVD